MIAAESIFGGRAVSSSFDYSKTKKKKRENFIFKKRRVEWKKMAPWPLVTLVNIVTK